MLKRKAWVYKSVMNVLSKACLFQRNESPRVRHEAIGVLVPGQENMSKYPFSMHVDKDWGKKSSIIIRVYE